MKSIIRKLFGAGLFMIIAFAAFAQDSTGTGTGGGVELSSTFYIVVAAVIGLYELIVRLVPTAKNISILALIITILKSIPNNKTGGGKFNS